MLKTRVDLKAGRWSPDLKAWFRNLLDPTHGFSHILTTYFKLLRDCNAAVLLTAEHGFEMALQFLGLRCMQASEQMQDKVILPANEEPSDVITALIWDLAESVCSLPLVSASLQAAHNSLHVGFPKFKALVSALQDMVSSKSTFHGIVFVRQQQGVHAVTSMLRNAPGLAEAVQFHPFTGHPAKSKLQLMREGTGHAPVGMATTKQQQALEKFRAANGQEVLVATAAAQEGLDIVNCSFVMCYSVTEGGVQLMQWRGRTRMFDSQIVMIMEAGSQDEMLFSKACMEETNDRLAQLRLASLH